MTAVRDESVGAYVEALASTAAVPGGGSAAALAASMGAALVSMVAKISARKAEKEAGRLALNQAVPELDQLASRLLDLGQEDIDAYRAVIEARKTHQAEAAVEEAYERAAEVPLATATAAARALAIASDVSQHAWEMVASDLSTANRLLQAGLDGALANVAVNLPELKGEAAARIERAYRALLH